MTLYKEVTRTGIIFKRPFRTISNMISIFRSGPKTGMPFMLKLESAAICNLKCKMCPLSKGLTRKTGFLKFEDFRKVYDEIRPAYLNLTGIGEPLLNKDLFSIINYARKKGSIIKLDTNATLLDQENIKKLISANPNFISISLDGVTKKIYESIRTGASFDEVVKNLKNLINYRNNSGADTKIHLFFVLQKDNIRNLSKFVEFGESIGADALNGALVAPMGKNRNLDNLKFNKRDIEKTKEELMELKERIKIKLNIEGIENFLNSKNLTSKQKPCFWPWYQAAITWDGYVVPCCIFCDNEVVFGNAFKEKFINIWNNKKAREFRKRLVDERTGICQTCGVDESFIYDKLKPFYKMPLINRMTFRK